MSVNKNESIEKLNWKILEKRIIDYNHNSQTISADDHDDQNKTLNTSFSNESIDFIPGGGIAQKFYKIRYIIFSLIKKKKRDKIITIFSTYKKKKKIKKNIRVFLFFIF